MAGVAVRRSFVPQSGLQWWFDADSLTTLYQDSGATTPVASDADPVGAWVDRKGNTLKATQATADKRPLYKTSIQNGRAALLLDGATTWMTLPASASFTVTAGVSAFGVWKLVDHAPAADPMLLTLTYKDEPQWVLELLYSVPAVDDDYYAVGYNAADSSIDTRALGHVFPVGAQVLGAVATVGGNMVSYQNGTTITGDAAASFGCPYTSNWAILGANIGGQSRWMNGYVCEVLLWNRALTAGEITMVQSYLATKWGISL